MADGDNGGGFLEQLPEEIRNDPSLQGFKDVGTLAKSLIETKRMVGASLRPPSADAGPEALQEFAKKLAEKVPGVMYLPPDEKARAAVEDQLWQQLGRPKDEKGYAFDGVQIPEGVKVDQDKVRLLAREMGWTQPQARKYLEAHVNERLAAQEKAQAGEKALRQELGMAYDERVAAARAAAVQSGVPQDQVQAMGPDQLRVWINVAKAYGVEGRPMAEGGKGGSGRMPPAEAEAAAADVRANPGYWDESHPQHRYLVKRHLELMQMAHPS